MRGRHPTNPSTRQPVETLEPTAPLSPAALEKFRAVVSLLSAEGLLYATSADALTRYAQLWSRNQAANAIIEGEGPTTSTATGVKKHPACSEADSTEKAMMAISREIGLTSISAGRIGGGPRNAEADELAEFTKPS